MNFEDLRLFRSEVAEPRLRELLERTEIPEGLCCIDSLEVHLLDGRSCGVDYHIMAEGLVYMGGQVKAFSYDEYDVSVSEFAELFQGALLVSEGSLVVHDEMQEMNLSTRVARLPLCEKLFYELHALSGLAVVYDYLPYVKMEYLHKLNDGVEEDVENIISNARLKVCEAGHVEKATSQELDR